MPRHLTPAHALAASVLRISVVGVVELIRHRRTVIPAFISPVIPHTGVRQHDATGKQRPVRLRRGCQAQTRGPSWPSALTSCSTTQRSLSSCSGSASGLPATKFTASRKREYKSGGGPPWPPPGSAGPPAIPVDQTKQIRHRQRRSGTAAPSRSSQIPLPSIGVCLILPPLPGTASPFFIQAHCRKNTAFTTLYRQVDFPEYHRG